MAKEVCANCEQVLGNLEHSYKYNGNVICRQCHTRLCLSTESNNASNTQLGKKQQPVTLQHTTENHYNKANASLRTNVKLSDVILILLILVAVGLLVAGKLKSLNVNNSEETKQVLLSSKASTGTVIGIVSSEEGFSAMIRLHLPGTLLPISSIFVREGDTIRDIKVVKIHRDKIEFEKDGKQWTQRLNEPPSPEWQ